MHRLRASADFGQGERDFALLAPGQTGMEDLRAGMAPTPAQLQYGYNFALQSPDYLRELDRGDSMRLRGGTLPLSEHPAPRQPRFIPVSALFGGTPAPAPTPFLNPPAGETGLSAAPSFASQMWPSGPAWQAGLDTAPLPAALGGGDIARSLPSLGKGQMNLKKAVQALGGRVLGIDEYLHGTAPGARSTAGIGLGRQRSQYVPLNQRIVGPGGQRLEDPAYLYEYAKEWYRDAAMRAHPDKGGTAEAMQAVNAAWAFIEKHFGSQALRESLNPRLFQR